MRRNLTCWSCKLPVLVKNVGEERTKFPGGVAEYLCKSCQQARVDRFVKETRERMGV